MQRQLHNASTVPPINMVTLFGRNTEAKLANDNYFLTQT